MKTRSWKIYRVYQGIRRSFHLQIHPDFLFISFNSKTYDFSIVISLSHSLRSLQRLRIKVYFISYDQTKCFGIDCSSDFTSFVLSQCAKRNTIRREISRIPWTPKKCRENKFERQVIPFHNENQDRSACSPSFFYYSRRPFEYHKSLSVPLKYLYCSFAGESTACLGAREERDANRWRVVVEIFNLTSK